MPAGEADTSERPVLGGLDARAATVQIGGVGVGASAAFRRAARRPVSARTWPRCASCSAPAT